MSGTNLYATKVFAEHPLALWSLDNDSDYISLIPPTSQDLSLWEADGAYVVDATSDENFSEKPPKSPFGVFVNGVIESELESGAAEPTVNEISFASDFEITPSDINFDLGSFAIGLYVFSYDTSLAISLGYEYTVGSEDPVLIQKTTNLSPNRKWSFISHTFNIPENFDSFKIVVSFSYTYNPLRAYQFAVNGISVGQWAEEFHAVSLGVYPEEISNVPLELSGVETFAYGLQDLPAYYISGNNSLFARNTGLPLVYGTKNSTVVSPNPNGPSLIVPGLGFLNQAGQYKVLTSEFWMQIQSNSVSARRVFGPLTSDDGLYVDGPFLKLKINENVESHFVGEWDRPMLVNIRYSPNIVSMNINGETVLSMKIDVNEIGFPEKQVDGVDQDWLGFYASPDVPLMQIESVAIYPYDVSALINKRRFVYGQAVDFPDNTKGLNQANTVMIDYAFSKYTKNFNYPKIGQWKSGSSNNLIVEKNYVSSPEYPLPPIAFTSKSLVEWREDLNAEQTTEDPKFLSLKPNNSWDDVEGHIFFKNINILREDTKAFYLICESLSNEKQVLFEVSNDVRGAKLTAYLEGENIDYVFSSSSSNGIVQTETLYSTSGHSVSDVFVVGVNMDLFAKFFGRQSSVLFGKKHAVKLYVGGTSDFKNTFGGKIFKVGFSNSKNIIGIFEYFLNNGFSSDYSENAAEDRQKIIDYIPSYGLILNDNLGEYSLDIQSSWLWEDYIPLSYLGGYAKNVDEKTSFSVDMLQFNIDFPKFNIFSNNEYDTAGLPIKTFISFQYLKNGSNTSLGTIQNTKRLSRFGAVVPGAEWVNTKYEVNNDTAVAVPKGVNPNLIALVIHIEGNVSGVLSNPVRIRSMQIAAKSLGTSSSAIQTKFGAPVFPYRKVGLYFDYKTVNPFSIYKGSTPYLYMTSNSGIRIRGSYSSSATRGLSIPINRNVSRFYKVGTLQMAVRYDEDIFPETPVQIFEIEAASQYIKFYLIADNANRKRGQIYAVDSNTGLAQSGVSYFIDGKPVARPILNKRNWTMLGLTFTPNLDFSLTQGALRITSPLLVNNISQYQVTESDEKESLAFRRWFAVSTLPDQLLSWEYWIDGEEDNEIDPEVVASDDFTWQNVLILGQAQPKFIDASDIYKQYTGTNQFAVQSLNPDGEDLVSSKLLLNKYRYRTYKDIRWSTSVTKPL